MKDCPPLRASYTLVFFAILLFSAITSRADDFALGADLSFLRQAEAAGQVFKDGQTPKPGLKIFRDHHYNWIRLRLFVEPVEEGLPNNLAYTLAEAQDAKKLGYKFLLDLHYASSWADPAKQPVPKAWRSLSHLERVRALHDYTRDTIAAFRRGNALPEMVQIGNEITHGILWPDGHIPDHWDNFADYLRAGIQGVADATAGAPGPKILLQYAEDGKPASTQYFFDKINTCKIAYDAIGFSYYPWWHGSLDDLRANLDFTANRYNKPIFIIETAYYWRPNDETRGKLLPFPETPQGQCDFLQALTRTVQQTPHHRGRGVFWWEPAVTGSLAGRGFFDSSDASLPVLSVSDDLFHESHPR